MRAESDHTIETNVLGWGSVGKVGACGLVSEP
jgi:hypothetical protein